MAITKGNDTASTPIVKGSEDAPLMVVFYSAPWCPKCKSISSFFFLASESFPDVHFYRVDVEKEGIDICKERWIESFPSFEFIKKSETLALLKDPDVRTLQETIQTHRKGLRSRLLPEVNWLAYFVLRLALIVGSALLSLHLYDYLFPQGKNSWLFLVASLLLTKKLIDLLWKPSYLR
uniref:Thioredoxin domain-containing protein n=1 Tax=Arcella intermedia TaxID=1963864 RepID=A0A6B2LL59_9EUKA